jgi:hypothetical protein
VRRLIDKLKPISGPRALFETENLDDAEVVVVSYGITSRVAQRAINWRAPAASAPASSASFPPGRSPTRTSANWPAA